MGPFRINRIVLLVVAIICIISLWFTTKRFTRTTTLKELDWTYIVETHPWPEEDATLKIHVPTYVDQQYPLFSGPGRFWQSRMYIWGARITTSYSDRETAFLDFWTYGTFVLQRTKIRGEPDLSKTSLTEKQAENAPLICRFGKNHTSPCKHTPNVNVDNQARQSYFRFRCDLSKGNEDVLREPFVLIKVSALSQNSSLEEEPIVAFNVSRMTDSVGLVGPENPLSQPFMQQQPVKLMLCLGGLSSRGISHVPEFLQHHIRVGVDKFVLGIHDTPGSVTYNNAVNMLSPLLKAGIVYLYPMRLPDDVLKPDRDIVKMLFYEGCLFHAKGQAELVANWDVDEYWMPSPGSSNMTREPFRPSLIGIIRNFSLPSNHPCPDWCFLTFPSFSIWRLEGTRNRKAPQLPLRIADTFLIRRQVTLKDKEDHRAGLNYVWQKSIAKTKNVFSSGCTFRHSKNIPVNCTNECNPTVHLFGSCIMHGNQTGRFYDGINGIDKCSFRVPELGIMHHYLGLFYDLPEYDKDFSVPPHVRDEYSLLMEQLGSFAVNVTSFVDGKSFTYNRVPGEIALPPLPP